MTRRQVLKGAGAAVVAGLLKPDPAHADWNKAAFEAKTVDEVLKAIGATGAVESDQIAVTAPDIAENGAVVPVTITSKLAGTDSIAIIGEKNPFPLVAVFNLMNGSEGYVSTRIKMETTSNVIAIVKAGDKVFKAHKEVKVTIGGYGG